MPNPNPLKLGSIFKNSIIYMFLIFLPSMSLAMDPPMLPPVDRTYPLDFKPMPFRDDPKDEDENMIIPRPISAEKGDNHSFEGMDVRDLQTVLENASKRIRFTIDHIKGGPFFKELSSRYILFLGDHGTGKTVLAKAVAHKLISETSWTCEYKSSREFMGKHRNETGVRLRGYLDKVTKTGRPTLLIIDQLNKILDYPRSESDDTAFASDLICNLLDNQCHNANFFFIGLMDRATELAKRLKSRLLGHCITTKSPSNPQLKRIIFTSKCISEGTRLHPEVTNEWLENFLERSPAIKGRNFRGLALQVHELLETEDRESDETLITRNHLETALHDYLEAKNDKTHIDPYESYWDRQERLHQEEMKSMIIGHLTTSPEQAQELHELTLEQLQGIIGM